MHSTAPASSFGEKAAPTLLTVANLSTQFRPSVIQVVFIQTARAYSILYNVEYNRPVQDVVGSKHV